MIYKKIKLDNVNIHTIKTDRFKTITFKINFKRLLKKDEVTIRNMLINTLFTSCLKYPTKRLMEIKTEDLYGLSYRGFNSAIGKYSIMSLEATFLNEKYTEKGMNKKSIDFIHEVLFNPNQKNNEFDKSCFQIAYNNLEDELISLKENTNLYSQIRLAESMDDEYISIRQMGYLNDLKNINPKLLYDYYLDVFQNDCVDIYLVGDINDNLISYVKDIFKFYKNKKDENTHFYKPNKYHLKTQEVIEEDKSIQSKLVLGFKLIDLTDFELRYVLNIYNYILGGSPDSKLFRNVREKESLCYSISSNTYPLFGFMVIRAGINCNNYQLALNLIRKELDNMEMGKFNLDDIKNGILTYENGLKEMKDSPNGLISLYQGKNYLNADSINMRLKKIKNVTKKDIISLSKKIKLDTIYLLKGTLDEDK